MCKYKLVETMIGIKKEQYLVFLPGASFFRLPKDKSPKWPAHLEAHVFFVRKMPLRYCQLDGQERVNFPRTVTFLSLAWK